MLLVAILHKIDVLELEHFELLHAGFLGAAAIKYKILNKYLALLSRYDESWERDFNH